MAADEVDVANTLKASAGEMPEAQREPSEGLRFLGREPILDAKQKTFGHELFFRGSGDERTSGNCNRATEEVIDQVLTLGLDAIVPGGKLFLKCTREALVAGLVTLLPRGSTVLELSGDVLVDDELVTACASLRQEHYEFALGAGTWGEECDRLLDVVDYVKLDYRTGGAGALRKTQERVKGTAIALVAENVETGVDFERAIAEGYSYCQGYSFARPVMLASRGVPANKMLYIQLLSALSCEPIDRATLERLVMAEASLCLRLLRMVNAAGMGIRNPIRTVRQAMLMIGEDEIRKLITIACVTALGKTLNQSSELIVLSMYRARFCELAAGAVGQLAGEQYLIGLLSTIDAILLVPLEQVVDMLPLTAETKGALLGEGGRWSVPLRLLRAYEEKQWGLCELLCHELGLSLKEVSGMYLASLRWAAQQVRDFGW